MAARKSSESPDCSIMLANDACNFGSLKICGTWVETDLGLKPVDIATSFRFFPSRQASISLRLLIFESIRVLGA